MAIKQTIPFNFDEIYEYIEQKFQDKGYDVEEGSNTMQLVTAMSYMTSMLNANTAVNINETLLPLARKRSTALQDARVLGYELEHIRSYQYNLEIQFTNDTASDETSVIKKYTKFTAGELSYYYMGDDISVVVPANDTATTTITVIEGTLRRFINEPTLKVVIEDVIDADGNIVAQHYIDVPFTDIEENGLEVYLTYYDEYGDFHNQELWEKSETFMIDADTILNKEYIRIDTIDYRTPRIYFKLGDVGKEIRTGTIIEMNALESNGANGKMIEIPATTMTNAEVLSYELELEGAAEESLESIKKNAPLFHNTANRVITKPDYIAFCNRNAKVYSSNVWDGHDEVPHRPGHIWFSFEPSTVTREIISTNDNNLEYNMQNLTDHENWYLDQGRDVDNNLDDDIQEVFDTLNRYKIPTLEFHHRNPVYFDFTFDVNVVKYDAVLTKAERNDAVFTVINEYFNGFDANGNMVIDVPVESFGFEFFQSNLNKRIDTDLTDIMGFNIELSTEIALCDMNIISDELPSSYDPVTGEPLTYYSEVRFHLGHPYEDLVQDGVIDTTKLPNIQTENLIGTDTLYVDYSSSVVTNEYDMTEYDIRLGTGTSDAPNAGDDVVGKFRFFGGTINDIEVILYVITDDGYTVGIPETDCVEGINISVKYPTPNIKFSRNTLPRLKQVNFV